LEELYVGVPFATSTFLFGTHHTYEVAFYTTVGCLHVNCAHSCIKLQVYVFSLNLELLDIRSIICLLM